MCYHINDFQHIDILMKPSKAFKIQTFCPRDFADDVRLAIGKAGGGVIGNYTHCAFVSEGHGYFLPERGANPHIGKQGEIEKVPEVKIEFICDSGKVKDVIKAIKEAHPYEEVPIDIFQLFDLE